MISAALLALALQGHVFDNFNDAELCQVMKRNTASVQAPLTPPLTASSIAADCATKRLNASIVLSVDGEPFESYIQDFLLTARSGVCDRSNPTMNAFATRGWRFAYRFESASGETREHVLDC